MSTSSTRTLVWAIKEYPNAVIVGANPGPVLLRRLRVDELCPLWKTQISRPPHCAWDSLCVKSDSSDEGFFALDPPVVIGLGDWEEDFIPVEACVKVEDVLGVMQCLLSVRSCELICLRKCR